MNYLVDTHIFLWILFSPHQISHKVQTLLFESEVNKFVSVITFWEISIKFSLKKLDLNNVLPDSLPAIAKNTGFEHLNLDPKTAATFYELPKGANKDPFDRMLAWQAIAENCILITKDKGFAEYKKFRLQTVW